MIALRGASLATRIRVRRSFRATAAVRVIRLSAIPAAIFASVVPLQGTITIASKRYVPEAGGAAMSSFRNVRVASFARSGGSRPVLRRTTCSASRLPHGEGARPTRLVVHTRGRDPPEGVHPRADRHVPPLRGVRRGPGRRVRPVPSPEGEPEHRPYGPPAARGGRVRRHPGEARADPDARRSQARRPVRVRNPDRDGEGR